MDEAASRVLAEYETRIAAEEEASRALEPAQMMARLDEFLLPIGPDTGRLLHILIKSAKARSILELGTSYGRVYPAVWRSMSAAHSRPCPV